MCLTRTIEWKSWTLLGCSWFVEIGSKLIWLLCRTLVSRQLTHLLHLDGMSRDHNRFHHKWGPIFVDQGPCIWVGTNNNDCGMLLGACDDFDRNVLRCGNQREDFSVVGQSQGAVALLNTWVEPTFRKIQAAFQPWNPLYPVCLDTQKGQGMWNFIHKDQL